MGSGFRAVRSAGMTKLRDHSNDCIGGKLCVFAVLPVGLGSAARDAADGPIVTVAAGGAAGAVADFCSGLSLAGWPGRGRVSGE